MSKLPEYLASIDFCNPKDPECSLFHFALGTNMNMFQWLRTQPQLLATFTDYNAAAAKIQADSIQAGISSLFPEVADITTADDSTRFKRDHVIIVDIGCGHGRAVAEFRKDRQDLRGRIVVQDLPEVIENRPFVDWIEKMAHYFLLPQPIKGEFWIYSTPEIMLLQ